MTTTTDCRRIELRWTGWTPDDTDVPNCADCGDGMGIEVGPAVRLYVDGQPLHTKCAGRIHRMLEAVRDYATAHQLLLLPQDGPEDPRPNPAAVATVAGSVACLSGPVTTETAELAARFIRSVYDTYSEDIPF